jgi:glycosyltransferase involved in cell wall biosynthesis
MLLWSVPLLAQADSNLAERSCSVIIPCLNEAGNIAEAVRRVPEMGMHTELIFVDGGSSDGTVQAIEDAINSPGARDIKLLHQCNGGGKAAAVFQGFDAAGGDIVIILDADLTVAPEDLPDFFRVVALGEADVANGNRFAFAMESGAMPPVNRVGNRLFAVLVSAIANRRLHDTLCGTKALQRDDWKRLRAIRSRLGGHDPWGDFDLLLGASLLGLRVTDVPVHYYARRAGESKMRPYRHALALARVCAAALRARFQRS